MFLINTDQSMYLTRGDVIAIEISATGSEGGEYIFKTGDTVRLRVVEKGRCDNIVLTKDANVDAETRNVQIILSSDETKLGEPINKPKDYWYEVELNPETNPQTIIGYDENGPKVFRLFPEGADN